MAAIEDRRIVKFLNNDRRNVVWKLFLVYRPHFYVSPVQSSPIYNQLPLTKFEWRFAMLVQIPPVLQNIERTTVTAHRRETPRDDVKHGSLAVWLEMEKNSPETGKWRWLNLTSIEVYVSKFLRLNILMSKLKG